MPSTEYSHSHTGLGRGETYDQIYGRGFYRHLWSDIERPLIERTLASVASLHDRKLLVDLACGTGRITMVAASYFDDVVGIDIAEPMLATARQRSGHIPNVRFIRADVHDSDAQPQLDEVANADCVTAFRLFTNADPRLRRAAAGFALETLKTGGTLVTNTHMTPGSLVGRFYHLEHRVRERIGRSQRMFNKVLAPAELIDILLDAGFSEVSVQAYGAFPGIPRLWRFIPRRLVTSAERHFGGRSWNQCALVVAKR